MKITKYGHSCLLVEESGVRLLVDPGSLSTGFEAETGISAVLYTHQHGDHFDPKQLALLKANNPDIRIIADRGTAGLVEAAGYPFEASHDGAVFDIGGVSVEGIGSDHAVIHPSIPGIANTGYLIAGRLFHPGDALTVPERKIEILALPVVAPWSKVQETADYLAQVRPKLAFPIHDAVTSMPEMYLNMVGLIVKGSGIDLRPLAPGESLEV